MRTTTNDQYGTLQGRRAKSTKKPKQDLKSKERQGRRSFGMCTFHSHENLNEEESSNDSIDLYGCN
jgi:hypothetical protein